MANIVTTLKQTGTFNSLVYALDSSGLSDMLRGGNYTLFAPTDAAFAKLPVGVMDRIATDTQRLRRILLHHIMEGSHTQEDIMAQDCVNVLGDECLEIKPSKNFDISIASFTETDIEADNGMIHSIDMVLLPKVEETVFG